MGLICNLQHNSTFSDPIIVNCISLQNVQGKKNSVSLFPKLGEEHVTAPRNLWRVQKGRAASNRNEYPGYLLGGKGGRCIGVTTLPNSCDDSLERMGASTTWNPQGLPSSE